MNIDEPKSTLDSKISSNAPPRLESIGSVKSIITYSKDPEQTVKSAYRTLTGKSTNKTKPNQDNYIMRGSIMKDIHLFAVCDGHG